MTYDNWLDSPDPQLFAEAPAEDGEYESLCRLIDMLSVETPDTAEEIEPLREPLLAAA